MTVADGDGFRREARLWLERNCPASMRTPMPEEESPIFGKRTSPANPDSRVWMERMAERGWTAPTWPRQYGGGGLSPEEASILREELARIGARAPLQSLGLWMLGPILLEYGTEEQKARHLPPIVRGEIFWCQGYSEPEAGSDLASLRTDAVDRGDHFVVNGQKIWTSLADRADWIFCLVRTDRNAKHGGISFLMIDMETPGVTVRPIGLISGSSPFCETSFVDVTVPRENLVGEVNGGWNVAMRLLQHERQNASASEFGGQFGVDLLQVVARDADGRISDPRLRGKIVEHLLEEEAFRLTVSRVEREIGAGKPASATSILKLMVAKINQDRRELTLEALGLAGLGWEGAVFDDDYLTETRGWLRSKANSIEGGTSEINLNVISKRVLGLPDQ
ncbi:MAG: acyl-CoA dehydrogenase family protein [Novosphingobium sp.]|nr:acyl-CoA dehydrogenase family protein [Novosphingobium sp.]